LHIPGKECPHQDISQVKDKIRGIFPGKISWKILKNTGEENAKK
jgi:hypothetical protein